MSTSFKSIEKIEPFAFGFLEANKEDIGYRIASGLLHLAQHRPLRIKDGH